ncbi:FMN-dependent NADH-azoreductase [Granulosicoccus sp. 3-233]|uniref:FMN-dependent NADH-azoreductase n=1 Tax=Granulosicoccus sp. 3-233 TaxID=3417969 RepID=UPI003D3570D2
MKDQTMKLLHIDSSILEEASVTRKLSADVVAEWLKTNPSTTVETLDLATEAPNHFNADAMGIRTERQAEPSAAQRHENEVSEKLVTQFLDADVVVIGVPFYNFGIPTQLKAWIDRVAQAGRTFKYTDSGPVGLAGGKTVILALARGGVYSNSEAGQAMEHQESYLKVVFGFFGITDIRVLRAEGVAMGEEHKAAAMKAAAEAIPGVIAAEDAQGMVA